MPPVKRRYITLGNHAITGDDAVCKFNMHTAHIFEFLRRTPSGGKVLRVRIPGDMKLKHDEFSGTDRTRDTRTLNELGYDVLIYLNGKWTVANKLKVHPLSNTSIDEVMERKGYMLVSGVGYVTKEQLLKIM